MSHRYILSLVVVLSFGIRLVCADDLKSSKLRKFEFTYQVKLEGLKPSQAYRLWIPMPSSNSHQEVSDLVTDPVEKLPGKVTIEPRFGNRIRYIEGVADAQGMATCDCTYSIVRKEVTGEGQAPTEAEAAKFLQADKLVPIEGKPLTLIEGKILPKNRMELGRVLYDSVNTHMKYSKEGTGWGRGDSNWACDSKFGNCSDFHSLFISLSRAQKMPAKFEIGFSLPEARGTGEIAGYHCWAFFQPEPNKGWVPVDISEANKNPKMVNYYFGNLTENRVALSTGRDITLSPAQAGSPLNFFIHPYAEVDGKPLAAEKIKKKVLYKDVE